MFPIGKGKEETEAYLHGLPREYQFPIGKGKNKILFTFSLYILCRDLSIEKLKIFNKNIQKVYIFLNDGNIEKILAILREILDNNNIGYNRDEIECPLCTRKNLQEE